MTSDPIAAARIVKATAMARKASRKPPLMLSAQAGPQEKFLATTADIAIFGGSAGGGKSHGLLLSCLRHRTNGEFHSVVFRREGTSVRNPGGLWDKSETIFEPLGAHGSRNEMRWKFTSGASVKFSHMEHDKDRLKWAGTELSLICFDELCEFTETQFWFMFSRLRSMSGVPGKVRASCNPDPDSFVKRFIQWWIDPETGYAIPERSGLIRWFIRVGTSDVTEKFVWADSREALLDAHPDSDPKSLTFIRSTLEDNQILLKTDRKYLSNLKALPYVDRQRLEHGNWNIKPSAGNFFKRDWFKVVPVLPATHRKAIRNWDRAATVPNPKNPEPDWTAGVRVSRGSDGIFYVEHVSHFRDSPGGVERRMLNYASMDGIEVSVGIEQEPGSAGVADITHMTKVLAGYDIKVRKPITDKETRANPASAQVEHGNVRLLAGPWNDAFISECENFPDGDFDDMVDAFCGAINFLTEGLTAPLAEDDFVVGRPAYGPAAGEIDEDGFDESRFRPGWR